MQPDTSSFSPGRRIRLSAVAAAVAVGLGVILAPTAAHAQPNTAVPDDYSVAAGTTVHIAAGVGLLANDVELDAATFASLSVDPSHGAVTSLSDNGAFVYRPDDGFTGDDTFRYCLKIERTLPCVSADATVTLHVHSSIERIGGADRFEVSANLSTRQFEPGVAVAYLASGAVFPDALSASAAAGANGAPVLLVSRDAIAPAVAAELLRLMPQKIVVLGGLNSVSAGVEAVAKRYAQSGETSRIDGADRFEVSAAISRDTFGENRPVAYIASGEVFSDALSGSPAAGKRGGPVLLVQKNAIPAVVATELARLKPGKIVVLGGPNTVADSVIDTLQHTAVTSRVSGADRFEVSAKASADVFLPADTHTVYIASGEVFPDALSGAAGAIASHGPVLLVSKNSVPASVLAEIDRLKPNRIVVLGGVNTVSDAVFTTLQGHLG